MPDGQERAGLAAVAIVAAGMSIFALFVHRGGVFAVVSGAGLVVASGAIAWSLGSAPSASTLLGLWPLSRKVAGWAAIGLLIGLGLAVAARLGYGRTAFPATLYGFGAVAALVGCTEELVYRGYIQGRVRRWGPVGAVACAAFCHAAYKALLFALPPADVQVNFLLLATATFLGGMAFGATRELSHSVVPPLAAHAVFDIVVYGDHAIAPWWVWA